MPGPSKGEPKKQEQQENALAGAAKEMKENATQKKSGRKALSSTAIMLKAFSETRKVVQKASKDVEKLLSEAITVDAHAASKKYDLQENLPTEMKEAQVATEKIAAQLLAVKKTKPAGETAQEKYSQLNTESAALSEKRKELMAKIQEIISKIQTLVPDVVTKLNGGNITKEEIKGKVAEIKKLDGELDILGKETKVLFDKEIGMTKKFRKVEDDGKVAAAMEQVDLGAAPKPE